MGSRYWNPFTGHSQKKATGTAIHDRSSVSLQDASRRSSQRPTTAASTTSGPIASGTVAG